MSGGFTESQQGSDHKCDLVLICGALTNNSLFDLARRILVNIQSMIRSCDKGGGPGRAHGNRSAVGLHIDDPLDRNLVRLPLLNKVT